MATYDRVRYWTTHNSYEGGGKDWIPSQLNKLVRCVELDIWDNDYTRFGDYRLGHMKPGSAVALGNGGPDQNPGTLLLKDWLKMVADWSASHRNHAPITIVLDVKSDLTDNDDGDLEDLNRKLERAFGESLFTRSDHEAGPGQWPEALDLRGRLIVVLSGDSNTRLAYRYCFGAKPAIAANKNGSVVIAYRSGAGDMRYWSGQAKPRSKLVEWTRKGTYGFSPYTVSEPSLAITEDGFIVSVHRIGPQPGLPGPALLECKVGKLQDDARVEWGDGETFSDGFEPSVTLAGPNRLQEIHKTPSGKSLRLREGTLNRRNKSVKWKDAQATQGPQFLRDTAPWNGHELRCLTNARNMVLCAFDGEQLPVRYRQVAFVELQTEEVREEFVDPLFYGAAASRPDLIAKARNSGLVARAWWFQRNNRVNPPSPPQENMAATDEPFGNWYQPYMDAGGQTES